MWVLYVAQQCFVVRRMLQLWLAWLVGCGAAFPSFVGVQWLNWFLLVCASAVGCSLFCFISSWCTNSGGLTCRPQSNSQQMLLLSKKGIYKTHRTYCLLLGGTVIYWDRVFVDIPYFLYLWWTARPYGGLFLGWGQGAYEGLLFRFRRFVIFSRVTWMAFDSNTPPLPQKN